MSGNEYGLTPDSAWVVGSAVAAAITAGPAYLARRNRNAARTEGEATRSAVTDALNQAIGGLHGRLDGLSDQLKDVQEWQAEHVTDHAVDRLTRGTRLERRREKP